MLRVIEILSKSNHKLICQFNNGDVRELDILPIVANHQHLNGVESILKKEVFDKVEIGEFGEILWPNIVKPDTNESTVSWDYDISPEFAYNASHSIK